MAFLRFLALVLIASLPAQASLVIGPATPVTAPAERVGAYRPQNAPSAAWNGEKGMVVWLTRMGQRDFVLANHVDANGNPLETAPLLIWTEGQTTFARVVPLGARFLVVWQAVGQVRAALVDADGNVLHRGVITAEQFYPNDVASNGTVALITGSSGEPVYDSQLLWLDANGNVFSRKSFGSMLMVTTLVRASGASFLVAAQRIECETYTCGHQFLLVHAEADGTSGEPKVIRTIGQVQSFDYRLEAIAIAQDRFLAVFHEPFGVLTGMLFKKNGDAVKGPFPLEDLGSSGVPIAAASDGKAFIIAYPHVIFDDPQRPVRSTRVRRVGTDGGSPPETLTQMSSIVTLQWTGGGYLLARTSETPGATATRLSTDGRPLPNAPVHVLSRAPNQQEAPDAVWDGAQLFTVWEEFHPLEGVWKVKFGTGRTIAESAASQRNARVVFDGSRYLVLWSVTVADKAEIHARRLHRDGSFAGDEFLVTATPPCASGFNAARVGDRVLVAHLAGGCTWSDPRSVLVMPIESNDTLSAPIVVAEHVDASTPVVASAGTSALVAWSEAVSRAAADPCPPAYEYCPPKTVVRGAVIDGASVSRVALADGTLMVNRDPEIAWNGSHYLIVWLAAGDILESHTLQTRLFAPNGAPASSAFVLTDEASSGFAGERHGSVTATAHGFLVAWRRGSGMNGLSLWRVAPNGVPIDVVEREVERETTDLRTPRLVRGPGASWLLYSLSGPDDIYLGHNRIVSRSLIEKVRSRAVRH